jgi:DNA replication protein DnaC
MRCLKEYREYELELKFCTSFRSKLEFARLQGFDFKKTYEEFKARTGREKTEAMKIIESFMKTDKRVLILSSPPGTGKTFASAFWLYVLWRKAWEKNYEKLNFFFIREVELFGFTALSKEEKDEVIQDTKDATFLVIDDFGQAIPRGEWEKGNMRVYYEDLITHRRGLKKVHGQIPRTIITTNLTYEELTKLPYLSERFWSRLKGISQFRRFEDEDYRVYGLPDFIPSPITFCGV